MQTSTRLVTEPQDCRSSSHSDVQTPHESDILLTDVLPLDCLSGNHLDWSYSRVVGTDITAPLPKGGVPVAPQMAGCRSESSKESSCSSRFGMGRTSANGFSGGSDESASYVLVARAHRPSKTTVIDSFKVDFDHYRVLSKRRLVVFDRFYDITHASVSYINSNDQVALCVTTCSFPEDPLQLSASWAATSRTNENPGTETPIDSGLVSYRLYVHILSETATSHINLAQSAAASLLGKMWSATGSAPSPDGGSPKAHDPQKAPALEGPPSLTLMASKEVTSFSQHPVSRDLPSTYISNIHQVGYFLRQRKEKPTMFHLLMCVDFHSITIIDLDVKLEKKSWEVGVKNIHQLAKIPLWHHWDPVKQRLSFWSFMRPMYWLRVVQFSGDGVDKKDILKYSRPLQLLDEFTFGPPPLLNTMPFGSGNASTSTAFNITMLPIQYEHGLSDTAMCHQVISSGPPILSVLQRGGKSKSHSSAASVASRMDRKISSGGRGTNPQKIDSSSHRRTVSNGSVQTPAGSPVPASREGSTYLVVDADLDSSRLKAATPRSSNVSSIDLCEQALSRRNWEDRNGGPSSLSLVRGNSDQESLGSRQQGHAPLCREIRCTITLLHNGLHRIEIKFTLDNNNSFTVDKNERVSFIFSDGVIVALLPGVFVHFIDVSHADQPPRYLFGVDLVPPHRRQYPMSRSSQSPSTPRVSKSASIVERYLHILRNAPVSLLQTGFGDCFFDVGSHRLVRFSLSKASVWQWIRENHLSVNPHDVHGAIHLAVTHFGVSKREGEFAVSNLFQMLQGACASVKPSILCQVLIGECYCTVRERCYAKGANPYWSRIPMTDEFGLKDLHALTVRRSNVEAQCVIPQRQEITLDCSGTHEQWWISSSSSQPSSQSRAPTSFASFFKKKQAPPTKQRISLTGGIVRTSQELSYKDIVANMLRYVGVPKEFADSLASHYNDVMSRLVQNILQYDESIKPALPPRTQLHFLHNLKITLLSLGYPAPKKFSDLYVGLALLHLPVSNVLEGIEAKLYAPTILKLFQCYPLLQDAANEAARDFGQSVLPIGAASPINPQYNIVNQWSSNSAKDVNMLHRLSQRFVTSTMVHTEDPASKPEETSPSQFSRYLLETAQDDDALMACTFPENFCETDPFITGERDWKDLDAVFELDRTEEEEEERLREELSRRQESLYSIKRCFKEIGNPLDYHLMTSANCAVSSPAVPSAQRQEIMASIEPAAVVQFYRRHLPLDAPYGDYRPLRSFVESPSTLRSLHTNENSSDMSTKRDRAAVMMMDALFPLVGECTFEDETMMFW